MALLVPVLALPTLFSFALQSLYMLSDQLFVGRLGGAALAGLALSMNMYLVVTAVAYTIGVGALAILSQAYGAGRHEEVRQLFQQALCLLLLFGMTLWLAGWANAERFIRLFSRDPAVVQEGTVFFKIYSASFFTQVLLTGCAFCFWAVGDFVLPTVVTVAWVSVNVALKPILIFGWGSLPGLGIAGAGWAAVVAQGLGVLAYLAIILAGRPNRLLVIRRPLLWGWTAPGRLLRIGAPAGIQQLLLAATIFISFGYLAPFGSDAAAATGLGLRIVTALLQLLGFSTGAAVASLVGQNVGAGRNDRSKAAVSWGIGYYVLCFSVVYALILWRPALWVAPFTSEANIRGLAAEYLVIIGAALPLYGVSIMAASAGQGLGLTFPPMLAVLVNLACVTAGLATLQFWQALTVQRVWEVAMLSLLVEVAVMLVVLSRFWRRLSTTKAPLAAGEPLGPLGGA